MGLSIVLAVFCFEVLDLDGSDSLVPPKTIGIQLAEHPHDLRRGTLISAQPWVGGARPAPEATPLLKAEGPRRAGPMQAPATFPRARLTLPPAALDDPAV
ncbi:MAG: hypothetical protein FJ027_09230 [Candidatus Rokubacteria bacterium]|nr:hypothetical protein [Candidatus Rokubacteria bacterium]